MRQFQLRIAHFQRAAANTKIVVACIDESTVRPTELSELVIGLELALDRAERAVSAGIHTEIYREHSINGDNFATMLSSDGKYSAFRLPHGKTFVGVTRENALSAAVEFERNGKG